jgi:hypothetical protein
MIFRDIAFAIVSAILLALGVWLAVSADHPGWGLFSVLLSPFVLTNGTR